MGSHTLRQRHGQAIRLQESHAFFRERGWLRVPRLVQWMVTLDCPLSCAHCLAAAGGPRSKPHDLPMEDAKRLIAEVAAMGVEEFLLTGGEPLAKREFHDIVNLLEKHRVRWSLNTAAMPDAEARRAIERWPPCFVAVSLDGPGRVHDAFRGRAGAFGEAIESIGYFSRLAPGNVAAGTTVTAENFAHLGETFAIVVGSGASQWGLHLIVPEGRAARRNDLLLSRSQLKELLRFAVAKRAHFPVTMADEIGYCGFWEPLLRDAPFFCGAGKTHCVVLPDGEVVPCTTVDASASAGNIRRTPLTEIWERGFAELRAHNPRGRCARCRYASACGGGCWLQRRHGTKCFKDVWDLPGLPSPVRAAMVALCLGLPAACHAEEPRPAVLPDLIPPICKPEDQGIFALERAIVLWQCSTRNLGEWFLNNDRRDSYRKLHGEDPGWKYFLQLTERKKADSLPSLARQVESATETSETSLSLLALLWRDAADRCLDGPPPSSRKDDDKDALRAILSRLDRQGENWRRMIIKRKLAPFLWRDPALTRSFGSKAGPPRWARLHGDLALERGLLEMDTNSRFLANQLGEAICRIEGFGEAMRLSFQFDESPKCHRIVKGEKQGFDGTLGVFEILAVPAQSEGNAIRLVLPVGEERLPVDLPHETELTYPDVLRLAFEQNKDALYKIGEGALSGNVRLGDGRLVPCPVLLPLWRRMEAEIIKEHDERTLHDLWYRGQLREKLSRIRGLILNFYLF